MVLVECSVKDLLVYRLKIRLVSILMMRKSLLPLIMSTFIRGPFTATTEFIDYLRQ